MAFIGVLFSIVIAFAAIVGSVLSIFFFALAIERKVLKKKRARIMLILGIVCISPAVLCVAMYYILPMIW